MTAIKLFRGRFGHVSRLNAASDLVTHAHPEMHIILWLDGDPGRMQVGATTIALGPEVAVGINSFEPHSHSFESGNSPGLFLAFYIEPGWATRRFGLPDRAAIFRKPEIALPPQLRTIGIGLFDHLLGDDGACDLAIYEIERLIERLIEASGPSWPAQRTQGQPDGPLDFRVRKAIGLMRTNIAERISLDDLARDVGLSRPHFFALFKEQTNLTPNVYWNTLRMEEALRQVRTSAESLTSVACNLGFTTQGNFTRFFRDHAGVPPTLYREASRKAA